MAAPAQASLTTVDAVINEPETFHKFPLLPAELRLMIWKYHTPERIITIDHDHAFDDTPLTQRLITETYPRNLDINQESRHANLKAYQSVFGATKIPGLWRYTGSLKSVALRANLKKLGLRQAGTTQSMPKVITEYMNRNVNSDNIESFREMGEQEDPSSFHLICPQWYNPQRDILLVNTPLRFWRYDKKLWCPWRDEASRIQFIAFKIDHLIRPHPSHGKKRAWNNRLLRRPSSASPPIRFDPLGDGSLESISLLCKHDCEIITIRMDETGTVGPNQWTYKLDLDSEQFKEQMGKGAWAGVTWRVTLGKQHGVGLWNRAATWRVDNIAWEQDKRALLRNVHSVLTCWYGATRVRPLLVDPLHSARLVPNGDGRTYVGPVAL